MAKKSETTESTPQVDARSHEAIKRDFNKRFGEGSIFTFDDKATVSVFPIPFGIPTVDYSSGIGGLPLGRLIEIYGPESSGKTSATLMALSQFQKLARIPETPVFGKKGLYVDMEHALDPIHMRNLGVNLNEVLISQPDHGEQALDIVEAACLSGEFGFIAVDSVPSLVPKKVLEGSNEDNHMAILARMLSQGLSKIVGPAYKNNVLLIFINQIREKMVLMGNPETTPGGRALKFYTSMRIDVRRKPISKSDVVIGQKNTMKFVKNKLSPPFSNAEYDYYWVGGIDVVKNIADLAINLGVINQKTSYFFFGEDIKNPMKDGAGNDLKWQGKEALYETLRVSPALFAYLNDVVMGRIPKDTQFVQENHEEDMVEVEALQSEEGTLFPVEQA